jgi:hypothetical protein
MNKNEMKEIALWIVGSYKGGVGSSSKYLLSRIMGGEAIKPEYPNYGCEAQRCFELYKNCSFVRNNIKSLYDEKYFGIFPIWKMLFEVHYPLYEQGIENWRFCEQTSQLEAINLLNENNIKYAIENKTAIYEVDGVEYKISENTKSSEKIADKILKKENTKKLEDYCEKYQNAKSLSKEDLEAIFEIGKHRMHDYLFQNKDFGNYINVEYKKTISKI